MFHSLLVTVYCNLHSLVEFIQHVTDLLQMRRQKKKFNSEMLDWILDDWMPWHKDCRDFSTLDVNRYVNCFIK